MGYEGSMGKLPYVNMGGWMNADIPVHFASFGPASLRFAARRPWCRKARPPPGATPRRSSHGR